MRKPPRNGQTGKQQQNSAAKNEPPAPVRAVPVPRRAQQAPAFLTRRRYPFRRSATTSNGRSWKWLGE